MFRTMLTFATFRFGIYVRILCSLHYIEIVALPEEIPTFFGTKLQIFRTLLQQKAIPCLSLLHGDRSDFVEV